jgi:D-alanyl-D-alanine carboxypeptidase
VEVADPTTGMRYGLGSYRLPDPCRPGRWVHGHDGGSWGTITMSFSDPSGKRRVSVAMTGRDYNGDLGSTKALGAFVTRALQIGCPAVEPAPRAALPLDLRLTAR